MQKIHVPGVGGVTLPDTAVLPEPAQQALARLRRAVTAYAEQVESLRAAEAALAAAIASDQQAGARAVLDDTDTPPTTADDAERALNAARSSLDVSAAACKAGTADLLAAVSAAAVDWRETLDRQRDALVADARGKLDEFVDLGRRLSDVDSSLRWLEAIGDEDLRLVADLRGFTKVSARAKATGISIPGPESSAVETLAAWLAERDTFAYEVQAEAVAP